MYLSIYLSRVCMYLGVLWCICVYVCIVCICVCVRVSFRNLVQIRVFFYLCEEMNKYAPRFCFYSRFTTFFSKERKQRRKKTAEKWKRNVDAIPFPATTTTTCSALLAQTHFCIVGPSLPQVVPHSLY